MIKESNNTLSDLNNFSNDDASIGNVTAAGVSSDHPAILNSISLNASRDRMNELFKDFQKINNSDYIDPAKAREPTNESENEKLQSFASPLKTSPEQPIFKDQVLVKYDADFTEAKTSNEIANPKVLNPQNQKITALYIGDLDVNVTEEELYKHFARFKSLSSVKVCREPASNKSLGYGYINFSSEEEAADAIEEMNYTPILTKEIRIMPSLKGRDKLKSLGTNVFVSNLNISEVTSLRVLYEKFRSFGKILSCKLDLRKRQGFISFEQRSSAESFVDKVNKRNVEGLEIYCSIHIPKSLRDDFVNHGSNPITGFNDYSQTTTSSSLIKLRKKTSVDTLKSTVDTQQHGACQSRHVPFKPAGSRLVKSPIESSLSSSLLSACTSSEVSPLEDSGFKQVYVKGLPVNVTEEQLKSIFSRFGEIVDIYKENVPKFKSSWGLVTFDTEKAALNAVRSVHMSIYEGKKITCVKALKRADRQLQLLKNKPNLIVPQRDSSMRQFSTGNEAKNESYKLYMYNLPHGINENFFKIFLRSYTLEGEIKKYNINYPKSENNYIEFEKESDAKEVLAKLNGVQISGNILQVSMYRLRPQSVMNSNFVTPSIRKVSFQEEERLEKYLKKVYNNLDEGRCLSRNNSTILTHSQQPYVLPYAQPGQIIPSNVARNAPLYQNINGKRYKLVPITRSVTFSDGLGFVAPKCPQNPSRLPSVVNQS